jgi:hypothetical protein
MYILPILIRLFTYRIYCYTHLAAFQLYSWRDQVNMQLTNRVGKTLAHASFYGLKLKLWQEKEDIMNRVGQICLATVHQRQLLTNVCSLAEAANDLSRVMHMQFVIHEALIYVRSYTISDDMRTACFMCDLTPEYRQGVICSPLSCITPSNRCAGRIKHTTFL